MDAWGVPQDLVVSDHILVAALAVTIGAVFVVIFLLAINGVVHYLLSVTEGLEALRLGQGTQTRNDLVDGLEVQKRLAAVKVDAIGLVAGKALEDLFRQLLVQCLAHPGDGLFLIVKEPFVHVTVVAGEIAALRYIDHEGNV